MEFVYVVKRHDLFERGFPHGLDVRTESEMAPLLERIVRRGFFVERRHAELDASMKQIIPYCVVVRGRDVFLTRRLAAGGESRLHGKRSIGIGGHVNPVDGNAFGGGAGDSRDDRSQVLGEGLRREIEEELVIREPWTARSIGVLNDDSTDVGSVHLGLVNVIEVVGAVAVRETEALEGTFVPAEEISRLCREDRTSFETWSALVIDQLPAILGA